MFLKKYGIYGTIILIVAVVLTLIWFTKTPSQAGTTYISKSLSSNASNMEISSSFQNNSRTSLITSSSALVSSSALSSEIITQPPLNYVTESVSSEPRLSSSSSNYSSLSSSSIPVVPPLFTGIIVPLYAYPGDVAYTDLIAVKQAHPTVPIIAIINTQGSDIQNNLTIRNAFITEATRLHSAGIKILGYVDTNYSARALAEFENGSCSVGDCTQPGVSTYTSNGIYIDGIFADQVCAGYMYGTCTTTSVSYYETVSDYIHTTAGLSFLMTNQGTAIVDQAYYRLTDLAVTFENDFSVYTNLLYSVSNPTASQDSVLIYNSIVLNTTTIQSLKKRVKYLYFTPDILPNPWDTLPIYLGQLAQLLE